MRSGFTVMELIIAMCVALVVCGALVALASDVRTLFRIQPETADVLQRTRAGHELLGDEIAAAGAGVSAGGDAQPLVHWIPAVLPYARAASGGSGSDVEMQAFGDRLTLISIPEHAPIALIDGATSPAGDVVPIVRDATCGSSGGSGGATTACGFSEGQRVLIFDASPAFDIATIRAVAPTSLRLDAGSMSKVYRATEEARVAVVRVTTFSFDAGRRRLLRAAGDGIDQPAVDEVVELSFRYFADPYPPESPRPPPGESNCLFDATGGSRLPILSSAAAATAGAAAAAIELPLTAMSDGPFCGASPYRFDADLYRLRRVHVRLRVQAASAWLRGLDPRLFRIPGRAISLSMQVPDLIAEFDVAPRSLQVR